MANERVLIVDDSLEIVDFISDMILKPNGYEVLVAHDGETGLKMALEQHPDLILLDMNIPKMNGMDLLGAMNSQNIKIPVIIMTSSSFEMLAGQAFRLGVRNYISKPFEVSEMLNSIEETLVEGRLRQERDEIAQQLVAVNQQLEIHLKELNTLFGIGKSVTSLLDQDKLLLRLVEAAIYLTDAEEGALLLVDQENNELYMVAARGIDERVVHSFRLKVEDSLAGQVITTGQPLILSGKDKTKITPSYVVRSLIYVPLKIKERIRGVFSVNNHQQQRDFTNHDLRLLASLADYAALTLENARLFNQAESERVKLANILGGIEEPVVVVTGLDNSVVIANTAFRDAFASDLVELEGQPLAEVLQNQSLLEFIGSTPVTDNGHKGEIPVNDGRTFHATLTPIPDVGRAIIMQVSKS